MLVVLNDVDDRFVARDATTWERVVARVRADQLDRELARGASPEASAPLAIRAQALVRPATRRFLARTLLDLLAEATHPAQRLALARIPPQRHRVLHAADAIQALVGHLLAPGPVPARGVALVMLLLTDGSGPLFHRGSSADLRAQIQEAVDALAVLDTW